MDVNALKIEEPEVENVNKGKGSNIEQKYENYLNRVKRKNLLADVMEGDYNAWEEFLQADEEDFTEIRKKFVPEFYELYNIGFANYVEGTWDMAKVYLENANVINN